MSLLSGVNAQHLQNLVNNIWSSANQMIPNIFSDSNGVNVSADSVTLLLDMSPEDRCYLNGEGTVELNSILQEKGCSINISTVLRDMIDNNQVSIIGSANNVHECYLEVCRILPITVWFDLRLNTPLPSISLDPTSNPLKEMQKTFNFAICIVPQTHILMENNVISLYIRSTRGRLEKLQEGIIALQNFIETNSYGTLFPTFQTKVDVPINRTEIIGRTHAVLDNIGQMTSTQITAQRTPQTGITSVSITGRNFPSVCFARQEISDRFIVELNFEITAYESRTLVGRQMERLGEENQVHILMKPSVEINFRTMIVRGNHKEVHKIFEVRRRIIQMIQTTIYG